MKKLLLFIFIISTQLASKSQNCNWAIHSTNTYFNQITSITTDLNDDIYYTGYFSSDSIVIGNEVLYKLTGGAHEFYIVKTSSNGNVLWARTAPGDNYDWGTSIKTDLNGNVYVSGLYMSSTLTFGNTILNNAGTGTTFDSFLVKYDSNGNVIWARTMAGTNNDYTHEMSIDPAGNVYISGYSQSSALDFGNNTITKTGNQSAIYIVKYDPTGTDLWAQFSSGNSDDYGTGITNDNLGNIYLTGKFSSSSITFGSTTLIGNNVEAMLLVKFDSNGNEIWGISKNDAIGYSVCTDINNNVYITGAFESTLILDTIQLVSNGYSDSFFAKYDSTGQVQWARSFGSTLEDQATEIKLDNNGDIYLAGSFTSNNIIFNTSTLTNNGMTDMFIIKSDSNGDEIWAKSYGGSDDDNLFGLTCDQNRNAYITADFKSTTITLDTITLSLFNPGNIDAFVAKINGGLTSVQNLQNEISLTVYPNPTTGKLKIMTDVKGEYDITIYNSLGKMAYYKKDVFGEIEIDLVGNFKGLYFYQIGLQDVFLRTGKIVLE